MAVLMKAMPFVLRHEGGWVNDPADPGGATNLGVTLAVFLGYGRDHGLLGLDLNHDGKVDVEDLKLITPEVASRIYREHYWRFDAVADQRVATKIFDLAVNMGLGGGVMIAQLALQSIGAPVVADGGWGPKTQAAVNAAKPDALLAALCHASAAHYQAIVAKRPLSKKFLVGWLRRAAEIPNA